LELHRSQDRLLLVLHLEHAVERKVAHLVDELAERLEVDRVRVCTGTLARRLGREVDLLPAVDLAPGLAGQLHELACRQSVERRSQPMVKDVEHDW